MAINQIVSGNVTNPIVEARTRMAMTSNTLARRLGLSRQYLSRAEQGTYSNLNPALLKWTANALGVTVNGVEKWYEKFQWATRNATVEKFAPHKLTRHDESPGGVLFERWRSGYWTSPTQFAVAFCVHPDLVAKYEEGITKSIPKQVKLALLRYDLIDSNWWDTPSGVEATERSLTA